MIKNLTLKRSKQKNHFILKTSFLFLFSIISTLTILAQELAIKGTVTEEANTEALPGVSITIKGTTIGTITDFDGNYTINAKAGDVITFQYVGFLSEEVEVASQSEINIQLIPDLVGLEEIVVIGYGVQKKKLNTGATVNIKGDEIQKLNTISPIEALKSNSPGVTITSDNGAPGSGSSVIIRGTGTMGDPSPLYVVDGVVVGDIDFLSPSDIASIDILKDAASTAIYGSRAANGVILVTTHKGTASAKPSVSYDGYMGWQQFAKRPGQQNAQTYMELMEESWAYDDKEIDWEQKVGDDWEAYRTGANPGTNWIDELYNENAPIQSHALNITGGNSKSNYSMGLSYVKQEGIIGAPSYATYERLNARLNSEHIVIEHKDRSVFKVGEVFNFSNTSRPNLRTGNIYWNDLHSALVTHPLLPMYADENTPEEYGIYHEPIPWASNTSNPVAGTTIGSQNNENDHNKIVGNVYAEISPVKNLVFRSTYGFDASFGSNRSYTPTYVLSNISFRDKDGVTQSMYQNYTWTWSNTLSYNFSVQNQHNVNLMAGQESRRSSKNLNVGVTRDSTSYETWERAYISNTPPNFDQNTADVWGGDYFGYAMLSYFGRASYDFRETLLATFVYRADASNNLAPGNQWGSFMSASLGYVLTNHDFMKSVPGLNYLKVRGGWGQNGNERIDPFQYNSSLTDQHGYYYYGTNPNNLTVGRYPTLNPNPNIGWETSEQTNIGFDANFLRNRLQLTFDWYKKDTKDWLVEVPKPTSNGTPGAIENGGAVTNKGVELALRWTDNVGDFSYSIGGNFAYNKNEVTQLNAEGGYFNGNNNILSQGTSFVNRVEVGYPIGYFYGLQTDGIIQNDAEAAAYAMPDTVDASGNSVPYFTDQQAGDIRFVDQNGDGVIDDEDKVMIGDPTPDYTFGLNISAEYKGIYMSVTANGAAGHQIAMSYRPGSEDAFTEYDLGRWHGEGTSTTQPRLTRSASHRNYGLVSDYYIHDADFIRISNITVGYDINRLFAKSPLKEVRLYFTGQNLFTFTKYPGMTPEVGYGGDVDWGSGIDLGLYPQAKTYMIGLSAKF